MSASEQRLDEAAAQLRGQGRGIAASAGRVLRRAVTAPRRTSYLRLSGGYDEVRVATEAVRSVLVARLDQALVGAAVQRMTLTTRDERLSAVELELVVRFGGYVADAAHLARTQVALALRELGGGPDVLPLPPVSVRVVDVTAADPRTTAPQDE